MRSNKNKNFKDRFWLVFTITMITGVITKGLLRNVGGIKVLPYVVQIIIFILLPIIYFTVVKVEKNKVNKIRYNIMLMIGGFITALSVFLCLITTIVNLYEQIWILYKDVFAVIICSFFLGFSIIILIVVIKNLDKI